MGYPTVLRSHDRSAASSCLAAHHPEHTLTTDVQRSRQSSNWYVKRIDAFQRTLFRGALLRLILVIAFTLLVAPSQVHLIHRFNHMSQTKLLPPRMPIVTPRSARLVQRRQLSRRVRRTVSTAPEYDWRGLFRVVHSALSMRRFGIPESSVGVEKGKLGIE